MEIIPAGTRYDFVGKSRYFVVLSLLLVVAVLAAIPLRGLRMGIDFAGGTEILVRFTEPLGGHDEGELRALVTAAGVEDPSVVRYGEPEKREFLIRFAGRAGGAKGEIVDQLTATFEKAVGPVEILRVDFVGPRVGAELRRDGLMALTIASVLILIYVAFRFTARFAPGAIVAILHDVILTAGFFVIAGMEFDLRVLAALLAIIGYSLNDTIIVYDRIRENLALHTRAELPEVINRSINQTLSRTFLTSGTTMLAVLALLLLGGEVIRPFAIAMTVGIVVGTYSSIYVAAPVLLYLERRGAAAVAAAPAGGEVPRPARPARPAGAGPRRRGGARKGRRSR